MSSPAPQKAVRRWDWRLLWPIMRLVAAVLSVAVVGWLLLALAGTFHRKVPSSAETVARTLPADAKLGEVVRIERPQYEMSVGTIKPVHEVSLASKILARVNEVRVKAGQIVQEGELLVALDDAELQARLKQLEASEQSAVASLENANLVFQRAEKLLQTRAIAQAEFDAAAAGQRVAAAELARVRQALEESRVLLGYATIVSPISGTVIDKRVEAGDTVVPGQVLMTLYDPQHMQMVVSVRESLALSLTVGQMIDARLDSLGYDCQAMISEIVPEARTASRSFTVKVTGPCPPGVYSGMFGRILIPLEKESVLIVPTSAVRQVGQLSMVDVVQGEKVQRRYVQLGRVFDESREVLAGLESGEQVILRAAPQS